MIYAGPNVYAHMYLTETGNLVPDTPAYDQSLQRNREGKLALILCSAVPFHSLFSSTFEKLKLCILRRVLTSFFIILSRNILRWNNISLIRFTSENQINLKI